MASAPPSVFERLSFPVEFEARFLLHVPDSMPPKPVLVVVTHGYGMNPEEMLQLVLPAVGSDKVIASIEAPNQHYLSDKPGSGPVGYNWGTTVDWKGVVRMHHKMVLGTAGVCSERFAIPPNRTLLLGFSQPVGLNYRLIATYPDRFRGAVGVCGGVPRDWEDPLVPSGAGRAPAYRAERRRVLPERNGGRLPGAAAVAGGRCRVSRASRTTPVPVKRGGDFGAVDGAGGSYLSHFSKKPRQAGSMFGPLALCPSAVEAN